jgi:hypothetical protein
LPPPPPPTGPSKRAKQNRRGSTGTGLGAFVGIFHFNIILVYFINRRAVMPLD